MLLEFCGAVAWLTEVYLYILVHVTVARNLVGVLPSVIDFSSFVEFLILSVNIAPIFEAYANIFKQLAFFLTPINAIIRTELNIK